MTQETQPKVQIGINRPRGYMVRSAIFNPYGQGLSFSREGLILQDQPIFVDVTEHTSSARMIGEETPEVQPEENYLLSLMKEQPHG